MATKTNCKNPPAFRYTWPGQDEAFLCVMHALKASNIAAAMGLYLQLISLTVDDLLTHDEVVCSQSVDSDDEEDEG